MFKRETLSLVVIVFYSSLIKAEGIYFHPSLISSDYLNIADLSLLSKRGAQLPGFYNVDVYLNDRFFNNRELSFISKTEKDNLRNNDAIQYTTLTSQKNVSENSYVSDSTGLVACFNAKDLIEFGVDTKHHKELTTISERNCITPGDYIPGAYTFFDFAKMRLNVNIPQASLVKQPRGWVSPERWDNGINALMVGYRFNGSRSYGRYGDNRSNFFNLDARMNIGKWRFRDIRSLDTYTNSYNTIHQWTRLNTYAERSINPWRSNITIGESNTDGEVFDRIDFTGVKLSSDDDMYPDTQKGYAPVIRGIAGTNAQLTVRQNGNQIYKTYVPAGPFEIDDLYAVYGGGDLEVTVRDADGNTNVSTIAYSSVPILRRQGNVRYSTAIGKFRNSSKQYDSPSFAAGDLQWGLPGDVTVYGGVQLSERYRAIAIGSGLNMGNLGAFSADITHADSVLADESQHRGQSLRFLYSRSLNTLGTTFQLTGYRYSTSGFYTLNDTAMKHMKGWLYDEVEVDAQGRPLKRPYTDYYNLYNNQRSRIQLNLSQRIGSQASVYLSASRQTFWNQNKTTDYVSAGLNSSFRSLSYNFSYSYNKNAQQGSDKTAFLGLSIPFSAFFSRNTDLSSSWANYTSRRDSYGDITHQLGMSGNMLEARNLNWAVNQGYTNNSGNSGNVALMYNGAYGSSSAGYSYDSFYRQVTYGVDGGIYMHRHGITFGQTPRETNALVIAPGASGIAVSNGAGISTDWRGYAITSLGRPYRENRVSLDITQLDERTELTNSSVTVVPSRGALVPAEFKVNTGNRVLMTILHDEKPLPFGTTVTTDKGSSGIVGDDGLVYLSGLQSSGQLEARWGREENQFCKANYELQDQYGLIRNTTVCM